VGERVLHLPLKRVYFDAIKAGDKLYEYRLATDYWRKRIVGREYDRIVLTMGYPAATDAERRIERPWRGYRCEQITHEHFGDKPVEVLAIKVNLSMEEARYEDDTDNWW
jgi:ASC-1-like (ASCH) protein